MKPWQVWLIERDGTRMNARFDNASRAALEMRWYSSRGYRVFIRYEEVSL